MTDFSGPVRAIIVDDMPEVRKDLRVLLELTGLVTIVGEAAEGRSAIALAEEVAPDVVLMDLEMPGIDGCTSTREIKRRGLASRVVVLSVHDDPNSVRSAKEAGADAVLVKGAGLQLILQALVSA